MKYIPYFKGVRQKLSMVLYKIRLYILVIYYVEEVCF